jgi:hypothetical protein
MSRRRHTRRNPLSNTTLVVGGLAVVALGVGGYFYWKSTQPSAQSSTPVLPNVTKAPVNVVTTTLVPGTMGAMALSSKASDGLSVQAPTGGSLTSMTAIPSGFLAPPASGANYEVVAYAPGATNLIIGWTDVNNQNQTSTIPITVT